MLIRKLLSCALFVFLLVFSSAGSCSEQTYTITETQLTQLENNLKELENINQMLLSELEESETDSQNLLKQSIEQKKELTELQNQLKTYKTETQESITQLEKANQELKNLSISLKQLEQQRDKYKRQRNLFEYISAGLLIAYIAK